MSIYRLAKESGVPYMTVNNLCNGKTTVEHCESGTLFRICRVLEVPMEALFSGGNDGKSDTTIYSVVDFI